MPHADPSDRRLAASIAVFERWAMEPDRTAATAKARSAFDQKFIDRVDPNHVLPPEELAKRVKSARGAYFRALALRSARARRQVDAVVQQLAEAVDGL